VVLGAAKVQTGMYKIVDQILTGMVQRGNLTVTDSRGNSHHYGNGQGEALAFRIADNRTQWRLGLHPEYEMGQAYMDGRLIMERGDIYKLLALFMSNLEGRPQPAIIMTLYRMRQLFKHVHQYNPIGRAARNVAHHYDLSARLYDLFLDVDRQYSCAYFEREGASLEEAQLSKKRHIAAKLRIEPGMRVLDIGSGWGGLGLYLARECGADVTGVTLSREQHRLSNERALAEGLQDRARFLLQDYRLLEGPFDRIVSVGMFEHVGIGHFAEFFTKCRTLLAPDGVMLLHSINRTDGPGVTSSWIAKYIFPGGYIPALSEVLPVIEKSGLYLTDVEILRQHYADTLKVWRERFWARRGEAEAIYDERFCRMWEFYLASSEASFRHGGLNNFQIQLAGNQHALPLTRRYMMDEEEALRRTDGGTAGRKVRTG